MNGLLREANLTSNKKAYEKINDLYQNKWITDEEYNHLRNLNDIRNLFVHDDDVEMGDDENRQQKLEYYTNNFQQCINYCKKDIKWFEGKIVDVHNGVKVANSCESSYNNNYSSNNNHASKPNNRYSNNNNNNYRPYTPYSNNYYGRPAYRNTVPQKEPKNKSFVVLIPAVLSAVVAFAFMYFFRQSTLDFLATKIDIESAYSKASISVLLGITSLFLIGGIFFYELIPQITISSIMGGLVYHLTRSDICSILMIVLAVLVTTRYSRIMRYVFFWLIYAFWLLIFTFTAPQFLEHFFIDENSTFADKLLKVGLPILAYYLVFFLAHFLIGKRLHFFSNTLGNNRMPLNTLVSVGLTGALGYLMYKAISTISNGTADDTAQKLSNAYLATVITVLIVMFLIYLVSSLTERKEA